LKEKEANYKELYGEEDDFVPEDIAPSQK